MIDWKCVNKEDYKTILAIAERAYSLLGHEVLTTEMDVTACHIECPLRLNDLLAADDGNFAHDIGGISRHIDRETGKLGDCFVPRYAV